MAPQKIYIAGPMGGLPDLNFPAFHQAAEKLRRWGHFVFNPAEHDQGSYRANLQIDLSWICGEAQAIFMLAGWEKSPGARAEHALAVALGLDIWYEMFLLLTLDETEAAHHFVGEK